MNARRFAAACTLAALVAASNAAYAQDDTAAARQLFADVNRQLAGMRKSNTLARLPGVAWTSEVRAWSDTEGVRKLEAIDRDDDGDVVTEYYYAGGRLVFAYQATRGFNPAGKQVTRNEEREYFADGRMFKWLGGMDKVANPPAGAGFAKESAARLAASAFYLQALARAAGAKEPATVEIGGQVKRAFGTVIALQNADTACMMTLRDDQGEDFTEAANFDVCFQKPPLAGKRVALAWEMANVLAASCQGDVACGKSDRIALVGKARIVGAGVPAKPAAPGAAKPATTMQESFCTPLETVVFSCRAGAKMASVCASRDASPTKGYVQYRFGKPDSRDPLELALPEGQVPPAKAASGEAVPFAGGGGAWMRFRKEQFAYVVYTGIGRWGPKGETREKQGIVVERAGKAVATLRCGELLASELGPDWFGSAGITPKGEDFGFPD
jgi:hypothetical protein